VPDKLKIDNIFITHGMFDGVVTFYAKDILSAKQLVQECLVELVNILRNIFYLNLFSDSKAGV